MPESLVERYEQLLATDPTSTLFVELARVLVEQGENARAAEVCQQGLVHHPESVHGYVLWGKALISLGRPAEAMEQFDRAVAVDRSDPLAYHLISEVLVSKGLYRSALPLLRKAVALSPGDDQVKTWLEQTQAALAGGPPPSVRPAVLDNPPERPLRPRSNGSPTGRNAAVRPTRTGAIPPPPPPEALTEAAGRTPLPERTGSGSFPSVGDGPTAPGPSDYPASAVVGSAPSTGAPPAPGADPDDVTEPSLLADVPEAPAPSGPIPAVRRSLPTGTTQAIAKEYEKVLRAKVAEKAQQRSWLQVHALKLAVAAVTAIALVAGGLVYRHTRAVNQGRNLADALAGARKALAMDTAAGDKAALESLAQAVRMEEDSSEAWDLTAYARAVLADEHGGTPQDRAQATAALGRPKIGASHPGLVLVARAMAAEGAARDAARKAILDSPLDLTEVHDAAGRLLLARGDAKGAVLHFKRALELNAGNVRALVALGDYYREAGDDAAALTVYGTAEQLSPDHPGRALGEAESRLQLEQDLTQALAEVDKLQPDALTPDMSIRRALDRGRLLSANGAHDQAVKVLTDGANTAGKRAFEFQVALGDALRASGDLAGAQKSLEAAVKQRPKSDEAKEALGRVLLGRDRERELLQRFADENGRRIALLRGIAWGRLKDWKKARAELARTAVGGKFPIEAVAWLALADAAEGEPEKAQNVLERTLGAAKRPRADVAVALGKVYWQRGIIDRAKAQFEGASHDPRDYEGACALGRLLWLSGSPERAVEPLQLSIQRNRSHGESRHALARVYLALAKPADAQAQAEAWASENPSSAAAQKDVAFALAQQGKWKDADAAISRSLKLEPQDPESHRLRASLLFARGDGRGGFAELQKANSLAPKDSEVFCAIGRAFVRQGNLPQAQKAYQAALREEPTSVCGMAGEVLLKPAAGKPQLSKLQGLSSAAPRATDRAWAAVAASRVALANGRVQDAKHSAELAVELQPFLSDAALAEGLVLRRLRDETRARELLIRAVQLDPADGPSRLALADALAAGGDTDARRAYDEYVNFTRLAPKSPDLPRVKKLMPALKKRAARAP
ncbi:MAG TPA: tetratricopeptide repeat protein [Myxococcaceae bacterium]|nr:tetratricopeptide repeat protein [Myxococcaceae bacterium]